MTWMKNILLTGGCGFLGSHTAVSLLNEGYNLNRFTTGHLIDEKGLGTKTWIS